MPEPDTRLGTVLLPGGEIERLRALDAVFGPMIKELGDVPDSVYLADPRWPSVTAAAGRALSAVVLAGGWQEAWGAANDPRSTVPTVELTAQRREVLVALAALSDLGYQQRAWPEGDAGPTVRVLSEAGVLAEPEARLGSVLVPGDEVGRLRALAAALGRSGAAGPGDQGWPEVVAAASGALAAAVIAGGW